ncbi:hypothetical protein QR685DRAFT_523736 [Neurospora intermedia]|uniref:Uncharacterized protein n=1 Tax=Neurospora intermedia TaxID=5142 RepID=A0ABR3DCS8_NEUIN
MRYAYVPQVVVRMETTSLGVTTPIVCCLVSHEVGKDDNSPSEQRIHYDSNNSHKVQFQQTKDAIPKSRGFWSPFFHLAAITLSPMPGLMSPFPRHPPSGSTVGCLSLDLARLDTSTTDFNISPMHPIHPSARGRYNIEMVRFSVMVPCY